MGSRQASSTGSSTAWLAGSRRVAEVAVVAIGFKRRTGPHRIVAISVAACRRLLVFKRVSGSRAGHH